MQKRQLHLNLFLNTGQSGSAWRWPESDPFAFVDVNYFMSMARLAERGTFDAVFLADHPGLYTIPEFRPYNSLEPTVLLSAIAAVTSHIGLIATASSTYNEPYNIARRFASLDHISGGRAAVNIVTTADRVSGFNFGFTELMAHDERYKRAQEFTEVLTALWDSWDDEALVGDKTTGRFVDMTKVRDIAHKGRFFSVKGPLNVPRSPQGRPVIVQAGGSPDGRELAARYAEAIFSIALTFDDAKSYAADLRTRAARLGRDPQSIRIIPGFATIIGSTEEEAKRREQELWDLVPIEYGVRRLAQYLDVDPSELTKLDEPLPDNLLLSKDGMQAISQSTVNLARREKLTVRQLIRLQGGGTNHRVHVGTPEQMADRITEWFNAGVADGFNVMPDVGPSGLEAFVDHVVPILRRRGLFRHEYQGRTLRDHLRLERPLPVRRIPAAKVPQPLSA